MKTSRVLPLFVAAALAAACQGANPAAPSATLPGPRFDGGLPTMGSGGYSSGGTTTTSTTDPMAETCAFGGVSTMGSGGVMECPPPPDESRGTTSGN